MMNMKNVLSFMTTAAVAVGVSVCTSSCFLKNVKFANIPPEESTALKQEADESNDKEKGLNLKASELMNIYVEWNDGDWEKLQTRLGLKCFGRNIQRQEDLTMDYYGKDIYYDATTDRFKKMGDNGMGIAVLTQEVDGTSMELMLASKADYDAMMADIATDGDYKEDKGMESTLSELPDMNVEKVFMKAVYDAELSKMAGRRLGVGYYVMFEGQRNGIYIVSFSHGNGDVEM